MITNYGELRAYLERYTARTNLGATLDTLLATVQQRVRRELYGVGVEATVILTTPSTGDARRIALPVDYSSMRSVTVGRPYSRKLDYATPEVIRELPAWDGPAGVPMLYTIEGRTLVVAPAPGDAALDFEVIYHALPPILQTPSATHTLLTDAPDVYTHAGLAEIYRFVQDHENAILHETHYQQLRTEFNKQQHRSRFSGSAFIPMGREVV